MAIEYVRIAPKKIDNVALSFSGGGFRAAAYVLGCLSYLERVQIDGKSLTRQIKFISSASGGSITNLAYTSSQRKGVSFSVFYSSLIQAMQGSKLLERVFEVLQDDACWKERPFKSRNLINAFSIAYDEKLFAGESFKIYATATQDAVPEVCINTTEFDNGMLFRFQSTGLVGNRFLFFRNDSDAVQALNSIKLGDILAASSCFPVGFEPIVFPSDFTHLHLSEEALENAMKEDARFSPAKDDMDIRPPRFGLMDGGIDDNQGIDSFIKAEHRLQAKNKFGYDLYISCDVTSNYTSGYNFPEENKSSRLLRLSLLQYSVVVLLLFALSVIGIILKIATGLTFALLGISGTLLLLIVYLSFKSMAAHKTAVREKNTFGIVIFRYLPVFLKLPLSTFIQTLSSRATSAGQLAGVVFLKKIRRISYDRLFEKISQRKLKANGQKLKSGEDESLITKIEVKHWSDFALQNALYLLCKKNNHQRKADLAREPWTKANRKIIIDGEARDVITFMQPSNALQEVASLATEMDTTLWFDKNQMTENKLAALVATGQFTTCYNLLRYALRFDESDPYWGELQQQLAQDWFNFKRTPFFLYNEYGTSTLPKFKPII